MKRSDLMDSFGTYYSQADIIKEFARELEIPSWQARDYVNILFEIIIDRLSDDDKVEIKLYNGLSIISHYLPLQDMRLKNIQTDKDKTVRLTLKTSRKIKNILYGMNKDKELEEASTW